VLQQKVSVEAQKRFCDNQWLDDEGVLGSLTALRLAFPDKADDCAIFITFVYNMWLETNGNAQRVYKHCSYTRFWTLRRILVPIFDQDMNHWIAAVVRVRSSCIYMYDSYANADTCKHHGEVCYRIADK
jgi:Ulp1 family protease